MSSSTNVATSTNDHNVDENDTQKQPLKLLKTQADYSQTNSSKPTTSTSFIVVKSRRRYKVIDHIQNTDIDFTNHNGNFKRLDFVFTATFPLRYKQNFQSIIVVIA